MDSNVHTISRKCGQKYEIMDKHFESTYEHSSEPRKCGQLFFKFGQYCSHFESTYEHSSEPRKCG